MAACFLEPAFMDISKIIGNAAALSASQSKSRYEPLPPEAFPAASLRAWLALSSATGVPSVPAHYLGSVPIEPLLHFDAPVEGTEEAMGQIESFNATMGQDEMLRWDCCAPWGVKAALGNGQICPAGEDAVLDPGDPRAFDLIYDYPAAAIPVFSRPWLRAMVFEDFPVEFRVFVEDGQVVAASNYYPQRALPDHAKVRRLAACAIALAQSMVDKAVARGLRPWMPAAPANAQPKFSATLDFLVLSSAQVLFLEGGPGFGFGAHPCCFVKHIHGMTGADPVEGLRLGIGMESIDLADLDLGDV